MLVHVKTPPTNIEITGEGAMDILNALKEKFSVEPMGEYMPYKMTDFYKEMKKGWTVGAEIRANRGKFGFTQEVLGKKIGVSKQYISDLENGRKAVSVKTAKALGLVFERDYRRFL